MIKRSEPHYFYCYATANDRRLYLEDIKNIINITNTYPGIDKVNLYIIISIVHKLNILDRLFVKTIQSLFASQTHIILKGIFFKNNLGRDFSSYSYLNKKIQKVAHSDDYVFFQNRSACGPFKERWLEEFIIQFERFDRVALCGSTINFKDHPHRSQRNDLPHIQTYAFLTKIKFLKMLNGSFPGEKEMDRLNIILNGEIGISQFFLENSFRITCLEWPEEVISKECHPFSNEDCKKSVSRNHPFYHRHFFAKNKSHRIKNPLRKALWIYLKNLTW